ncbi:hypothetical protein HDV00_007587 [Rhizophlyctis rosea]|nr:hypothetical protein HDV00_007587 [Rhizophlyctis rosea]
MEADDPKFVDLLGWLYLLEGKLDEAKAIIERQMREGEKGPHTLALRQHLAAGYQYVKDYPAAERCYEACLKELANLRRTDEANTRRQFAALYIEWGKYDKAEPLYLACADLAVRFHHPDAMQLFGEVVKFYRDWGKVGTAARDGFTSYLEDGADWTAEIRCLVRLEVRKRAFGENHPNTRAFHDEVMEFHKRQHRKDRGMLVSSRAFDGNSATSFCSLAIEQGAYEEAESIYQTSLKMRIQVRGKKHRITKGFQKDMKDLKKEWEAKGQTSRILWPWKRTSKVVS